MTRYTRAKEERRARILQEARRIVAEGGVEALTTRGLAQAADVTVPTIYNLIGNREEVLYCLTRESIARLWARLDAVESAECLAMAEAIVEQTIALFTEDEAFFRAAVMAQDHLLETATLGEASKSYVEKQAARMAAHAAQQGIDDGQLHGRIPADALGEQMYLGFDSPMRAWGFGRIPTAEFRFRALRGFYLTLASDAVPAFHAVLLEKLKKLLDAHTAAAPSAIAV